MITLALWWGFKLGWAAGLLGQARRGRYAPAYVTAALTAVAVYGFGWLAFEPAMAALLACGMSLQERRQASTRTLLLSEAVDRRPISDLHLLANMRALERGGQAYGRDECRVPSHLRCLVCERTELNIVRG